MDLARPSVGLPECAGAAPYPARAIIWCLNGPYPERQARRVVGCALDVGGLTSQADDVALAASELVTNARRHAPGPYELRVYFDRTSVKVAVLDGGTDHAELARKLGQAALNEPVDGESGRGLQLVTGLFPGCWGTEATTTCTGSTPAKQAWITVTKPCLIAAGNADWPQPEALSLIALGIR
ncbi:MAG TPA: ATP-binding protein [Streptosporangiaceae bacterium]|nr:ATP-binding protein [Streptosporangiaceae bacterium]